MRKGVAMNLRFEGGGERESDLVLQYQTAACSICVKGIRKILQASIICKICKYSS